MVNVMMRWRIGLKPFSNEKRISNSKDFQSFRFALVVSNKTRHSPSRLFAHHAISAVGSARRLTKPDVHLLVRTKRHYVHYFPFNTASTMMMTHHHRLFSVVVVVVVALLFVATTTTVNVVQGQAVDPPTTPKTTPVEYTDDGDFALTGHLAIPSGTGLFPAVIIVPDGGELLK